MKPLALINVVALSGKLLDRYPASILSRWCAERHTTAINVSVPAVTCTSQADYLTGVKAQSHGIVSNGWYFKDECEVKFWRQSNRLVTAPKVWDLARQRDPSFTCANMFWWYNMYSSVDYSVTPRPQYRANGLKTPDCYSTPASLRDSLQEKHGTFPLFSFWGPGTNITSSRWIADATKDVFLEYRPTLTLVYLPHLDYNLQKLGPENPEIARDLDDLGKIFLDLVHFFEAHGVTPALISEYHIFPVERDISLNRALREQGFIAARSEEGREYLDCGASDAFAVADHQAAHVYCNRKDRYDELRALLEGLPGVQYVWDEAAQKEQGVHHPRSGDFLCISENNCWFSYYYWLDDDKAPDFARTVDIHRKPGYDPNELFIDPAIRFPQVTLGMKLLRKKLGSRVLFDVIPVSSGHVKGSHGSVFGAPDERPVTAGIPALQGITEVPGTGICDSVLNSIFE